VGDGALFRFDGKTCVIAGGARGIGEKTAETYIEQGGRVVIGDRNVHLGEALAARLGEDRAAFFPLDVADAASCAGIIRRGVERFGGIDHLVNCAITMRPGALVELSEPDWRQVLDVGLTGTFLMCQAFGRWMLQHERRGAVVNLTSLAAVQPYAGAGPYSTVKAGVAMLTFQLALEWAPLGIRVNAVAPGHTETPLTAYLQDPEIKRARSAATPIPRVGKPEDMAAGILYLLSDEADYTTAAQLMIDGGVSMSVFNHLPGRSFGSGS
jgi:NAD(P)-dependent dehydrogenase (short-subunit alcohol dehydrogenase family)